MKDDSCLKRMLAASEIGKEMIKISHHHAVVLSSPILYLNFET
jgi:hypothetical protein